MLFLSAIRILGLCRFRRILSTALTEDNLASGKKSEIVNDSSFPKNLSEILVGKILKEPGHAYPLTYEHAN